MELPKTPAFRLDGKRALVTGASSGIGLGCAAGLAEYGAEIVVAARSKEKLDEFVRWLLLLAGLRGDGCKRYHANATDPC